MIEFKKTNIDNLNKYIKLYKKAFKNFTKSYNYFNWLYVDNPQGSFVGVDCYDDDILIGQVGGIPHDFIFNKKKVKFLISINVCVDPKYQGQGIFSKLLLKFEQTAKDLDFDGIIAVANKAASQPWQRSVKLKKLKALDVFVGYGKLNLDRFKKSNYNFYTLWDKRNFEWRMKNPMNKTYFQINKNNKSIYSKTNFSFINAYSPMIFLDEDVKSKKINDLFFKPSVYVGLVNDFKKTPFMFNLPEFLKPSPLNFLYKFLKSDDVLDEKKIFFTFLDFDAF